MLLDGSETSPWVHTDRIERRQQARAIGPAGDVNVSESAGTGAIGDTRADHDQRPSAEIQQAGDRQLFVEPFEQCATGRGQNDRATRGAQPRQRQRPRR